MNTQADVHCAEYCQYKRETALARARETGVLRIHWEADERYESGRLAHEPDWTGPYLDFCRERRLIACTIVDDGDSRIEVDLEPAQRRLIPYGLWRINLARAAGYLVLAKGESDWWTLDHQEFPALGLPGENMAKVLQAKHLDHIERLYVAKQPDGRSDQFMRRVLKRLERIGWQGQMYTLTLPEGVGDINDLHRADPGAFKTEFQKAMDAAEPFPGDKSKGDTRKPGFTKAVADAIAVEAYFARDAAGRLYRYDDGVYQPDAEFWIRKRVKTLLEEWSLTKYWGIGLGRAVIEYLLLGAPRLWDQPPMHVINVKNGLLDVNTLILAPHSPAHLSSIRIPIEYDAAATCPRIERFVEDVFPEDARALAWEIFGDLITPDRSIPKAILLVGDGGNGKSVFLMLATNFVGRENVATVSLHRLESDRFSVAQIFGRLANVCADLPGEHLSGTSVLKGITGGDAMPAEFKFKDQFTFKPFARLLFSANTLPRGKDSSKGFFDRWVVVPFERNFRDTPDEIPRAQLDAQLSTPEELSGALNKALAALTKLRERGRFTEAASTRAALEEFQAITDPLGLWLNRETITDPKVMVAESRLHDAYNAACDEQGRAPMTSQAFGRALKRLRPAVQKAQRTIEGTRRWVYLGIALEGEAEAAVEEEEKAAA